MKTPLNKLTDAGIDALLRAPTPPATPDFEQRLQDSIQAGLNAPQKRRRAITIRLFSASLAAAAAVAIFLAISPAPVQTAPTASVIEEELFVLCDFLVGIDLEAFEDITYYASSF